MSVVSTRSPNQVCAPIRRVMDPLTITFGERGIFPLLSMPPGVKLTVAMAGTPAAARTPYSIRYKPAVSTIIKRLLLERDIP